MQYWQSGIGIKQWTRSFKDIRYGVRGLLKHPGFTGIVVITLALGIGASTAIFSVVDSVLLRRLPYRNAERIVAIQEVSPEGKRIQTTSGNFLDWRAQNSVFEHLSAIRQRLLTWRSQIRRNESSLRKRMRTSSMFSESRPQYGRLFIPQDEQAGHQPVVVVSDSLWQRRFGSDPSIVGKPIMLDGTNYTVIGVAPPGFQYPDKTEVWLPPLQLVPELYPGQDLQNRRMGYLTAVALVSQVFRSNKRRVKWRRSLRVCGSSIPTLTTVASIALSQCTSTSSAKRTNSCGCC